MGGRVSEDLTIRRFGPADEGLWNGFIQQASNATFLHERGFMEYHADRFEDFSLIIEDAGKPTALLPANRVKDVLFSHGGLTYGGLLVPPRLPAITVVEIIRELREFLTNQGVATLIYKPIPHIFHDQPSEADLYALVNAGAKQNRADLGAAIPLHRRLPFNSLRKRGVKKALKAGIQVRESTDFGSFWSVLHDVLSARHNTTPIHSLNEIELLKDRFPDKIFLFAAFQDETVLAGMVMFDCGPTVHAQYIATTQAGRDLGALDLLVHHLLGEVFVDRDWFSFGISTTDEGRELNVGLSRQKEMFGGHSVVFSQYRWDLT